jgi:DNA-binding NarL/FixJ family response regulator
VPLRLLIVDDNRDVLAAIRDLLEGQGITVVGVAVDIAGALSVAAQARPDAALVDIELAGETGFALIERLDPAVRAVLTSTHAASDYADLIDGSRALGFLPKSELSAAAIETVLSGLPGTG